MDTKTINTCGNNTIKTVLEKASKQGAKAVVLIQNTKEMTRTYVETQINSFKEHSPQKARDKIEWVIVVVERQRASPQIEIKNGNKGYLMPHGEQQGSKTLSRRPNPITGGMVSPLIAKLINNLQTTK